MYELYDNAVNAVTREKIPTHGHGARRCTPTFPTAQPRAATSLIPVFASQVVTGHTKYTTHAPHSLHFYMYLL